MSLSEKLRSEAEDLESGLVVDELDIAKLLRQAAGAIDRDQKSEVLVRVATELLEDTFNGWSAPVQVAIRPVEGRDPMGATHEMLLMEYPPKEG